LYKPRSGICAIYFNIFGVFLLYLIYGCKSLISFNNMNCPLVSRQKKITYFHQLKSLDPSIRELKLSVIRFYLKHSREAVVVQSQQVCDEFIKMFGKNRHVVNVAWPGISIPSHNVETSRLPRQILVPVASPGSPHKNFPFIRETSKLLGPDWDVVVTAPEGLVDPADTCNIRFIGTQDRVSLFELYRQSACVMMASTHETIGLPIFEALSVGTPVVAFDAPYIRSLQIKFGITSGLELSSSPEGAREHIERLSQGCPAIQYCVDFQAGDWNVIFDNL
jgi:glycosyltransferase involved in cell wall biosynthesis